MSPSSLLDFGLVLFVGVLAILAAIHGNKLDKEEEAFRAREREADAKEMREAWRVREEKARELRWLRQYGWSK